MAAATIQYPRLHELLTAGGAHVVEHILPHAGCPDDVEQSVSTAVELLTATARRTLLEPDCEDAIAPISWSIQEVMEWLVSVSGRGSPTLTWIPKMPHAPTSADPRLVAHERLWLLREELLQYDVEVVGARAPYNLMAEVDTEQLQRMAGLAGQVPLRWLVRSGLELLIKDEERRWKRLAKRLGGDSVDRAFETRGSRSGQAPSPENAAGQEDVEAT